MVSELASTENFWHLFDAVNTYCNKRCSLPTACFHRAHGFLWVQTPGQAEEKREKPVADAVPGGRLFDSGFRLLARTRNSLY